MGRLPARTNQTPVEHASHSVAGKVSAPAILLLVAALIGSQLLFAGTQDAGEPTTLWTQASTEAVGEQSPDSHPQRSIPFVPLTGKEKFHSYLKSLYSPINFLGTVSQGGINQARDIPTEWKQGMKGYGRRVASSYARRVIKESIDRGLGGMIGYDPRYFHSERHGIWNRGFDAAIQVFRCRDDDGRWRIAYPRLAGAIGSALISRAWMPERYQTVPQGLKSGAISVGLSAALNLLKEFW